MRLRDGVENGHLNPCNGTNLFRDSIASTTFLLDGLDPECLTWASGNAAGCRLTLKDSAINLTIPEGALSSPEELYCAVLTDEKDRPPLNGTTYTQNRLFSLTQSPKVHI